MSNPDEELPRDPDWADVPTDLRILHGLNHGIVTTLEPDGIGRESLCVVPSLHAHARRLADGDIDAAA